MTLVATSIGPLDVMNELVTDTGEKWGDIAAPFQRRDAEAIFDPTGPLWHYLTRPRGGSKSTDIAAMLVAWLVVLARPLEEGLVVASSEDQAEVVISAMRSFVVNTSLLEGVLAVEGSECYAANGAHVRVITSDGSSAFGRGSNTGFLVLDEFAQWPQTKKMRSVWVAMLSSTQKSPNLRLVILTSAGEPGHFSYGVIKEAKEGEFADMWDVNETPGLVPWADERRIRAQNPLLSDDEFARLHLNQWTESSDVLLILDDWEAAAVLDGSLPPQRNIHNYIVTVDLGVKVDPTVVVVAHSEPMENSSLGDGKSSRAMRIVVDRLDRFVPNKRKHQEVDLDRVEKLLYELSHAYNRAPIYGDPSQFHSIRQRLLGVGCQVREFKFTPTSTGELGSALVQALRNRQVWLPKSAELGDELLHVRLRESSPGVYRLDHDSNRHDDQAVAIGMAVHHFFGKRLKTAVFRDYMAKKAEQRREDAEHPSDVGSDKPVRHDAVARHMETLQARRKGAERAAVVAQRRCEHRWRKMADGSLICVMGCGTTGAA